MVFGRIERRAKAPLIPPDALTPQLKKINADRAAVQRLAVRDVVRSLAVSAAGAVAVAAGDRPRLPADGARDLPRGARPAGKLVGRAGVRAVLGAGLLMLATGLVLLSRIGAGGSAIQYVMLPGLLISAGIGFSVVSSTIAATMSAGPTQAGLTSSLVNTARQVGGGLGLAVLISLATQRTAALIGDGDPVAEALTAGFSLSFLAGAVLVGTAAVLTFTLLPGPAEGPQRAFGRRVLTGAVVVIAAFVAIEIGVPRSQAAPPGEFTTEGAYSYVSAPDLHPPELQVIKPREGSDRRPGYFMTANFLDVTEPPIIGQSGPMMLDDDMQPVWFKPGADRVPGGEPRRPHLRGPARARVVAGRRRRDRRDQQRRDRDRGLQLPDGRDARGRRRLGDHAALAAHRGRCRLGDGEQEHPGRPLGRRRRQPRRARRLGAAGLRPQDRQAALHVVGARAHRDARLRDPAAAERVPVGRVPHQLAPARRRRQGARLDAQHVGGLSVRPRHRQDRVAARRRSLELRIRARGRVRVAARRHAATTRTP